MPDLQALGRAIKQAQYRHHRALDTALTEVGSTLAQWDALRAIDRTPGSTARALAEQTFQSEQSFGTLATRLLARDLIERAPGRGRAIEHRLTPEGERTLAAANRVADAVLAESFAALSAAERATLRGLLERVGTH
ncbi:MarR family winged helix-turn-helix transcriptional regulator [Nocardia sp. NPDC056100]|uniref:MarR family winged helix-turn-helix transcriptional regulator n=1 Tax=Nocardia sp. NPDC056100 TaxID=3345712 RepID=UPI0035DE1317